MSVAGGEVKGAGKGIGGDDPRTIVARRYRVDIADPIGSGGMAVVYRGRDLRARRDVALKTLLPEFRGDAEARARFRREVRHMSAAAHPNVAQVFDIREESEATWVVLEFVPGETLKERIARQGPLGPAETAKMLDQAAAALTCLHDHRLVHLDVKPQNLVLRQDGVLKLIDFGLAQTAGQTQERIGGNVFGTAAYLAPEQARGEAVDFATDIYALGCVVYELLTGRPPFPGAGSGATKQKQDVIRAHRERVPLPPSQACPDRNLPGWVDDVVLRALAKQPADRYADVAAFARAFRTGRQGRTEPNLPTTDRVPTIEMPTPHAAPTAVEQPIGAHPAHWLGGAMYRAGGRAARRTRRVQPLLWRLAAAFLVANLMLLLITQISGGVAADWLVAEPALHAGGRATVVIDGLNLREEPGLGETALAQLPADATVSVTGPATSADGLIWWPVSVGDADAPIDGYVWQDGIEATGHRGPLTGAWRTIRDGLDVVSCGAGRLRDVRRARGGCPTLFWQRFGLRHAAIGRGAMVQV